jgi:hypothetical protein
MMTRLPIYLLCIVLILAVVLAGLGWQEAHDAWPTNEGKTLIKSVLYYESWLMPFLLPLVVMGFKRQYVSLGMTVFSVIALILGIYARFVEPNLLLVKHTSIKTGYTVKLALISDMHYGLYSTQQQMQRLVDKLNSLDVDAVVVAGDWTYEPSQLISLTEQLKPFSQLKHPIYSVTGNHDEQTPGPPLERELNAALIANHIHPIEGRSVRLGGVRLVGVDYLKPVESVHFLLSLSDNKPLLLLTHDPDTLDELPPITQPFVMLAGHTHGGQVNLPILSKRMLMEFTHGHYQRGLYPLARQNQIFVSSGIGMVGLPLRFAMPPVIDVLEMY